MSRKITDFQLVDHGIENEQYFRGCGVAFTQFSDVATGIGDNPAAAIDDCLESIAQNDVDVEGMEARILADIGRKTLPKRPRVKQSTDGCWYYISIRYNVA